MPPEERITRELDVLRREDGATRRTTDLVAEDAFVTFHIEPIEGLLDIVMSPEGYREFLLGHLYSEGMIKGPGAVREVLVGDRGSGRVEVLVELEPEGLDLSDQLTVDTLVPGKGLVYREHGSPPSWYARPLAAVDGRLAVEPSALLAIPSALRERTRLFERTGAFHYAFVLARDGSVLHGGADIGRHTAVDKAIGRALEAGEALGERVLYTTGRIATDTVRKCLRSSIPLVVSRGAPMAGAVELARRFQLAVVGFLRGGRFNVYSGEDQIAPD